VPLAQKYGRGVLALGGLLMVAGIAGEWLAASHVGVNGSPWPVVPGLVVAGAGLALLVIPLVNVVLAAVPAGVAGGASGLFGTAQQLGVAVFGTVFFGYLTGRVRAVRGPRAASPPHCGVGGGTARVLRTGHEPRRYGLVICSGSRPGSGGRRRLRG
jgi:hypothetical protein